MARTTRLHINPELGLYWTPRISDAKITFDVPVLIKTLRNADRAYPWGCWLADSYIKFATENPDLMPESIQEFMKKYPNKLQAYVTRTVIYVTDQISNGRISHCIRWGHNLSLVTQKFDKLPRARLIKWLGGRDQIMQLKVLKYRPGQGGYVSTGNRTGERIADAGQAKGFRRRLIDAKMLPSTML
jgi:hypothetical protein